MDETTIRTLVSLLQGGGPIVTIFAVFIAWKAGQTAKEAVTALIEMRNAVVEIRTIIVASGPRNEKLADLVEDIDKRTQSMDIALASNGQKLDRLVPIRA